MPAADLTPYYQPPGTGADGTKFDNALAYLQTIVNGLDQNNWAAGLIFDPAKIMQAAALDGDTLVWDNANTKWVRSSTATRLRPPGYQFDYAEFTANVAQTATSAATANTVVTGAAVTYDGSTPVWVEFFAPDAINAAGQLLTFELYDGAASLGSIAGHGAAAAIDGPIHGHRKLTPSAATHTYSVRVWGGASGGTVKAGAGSGPGVLMPGFLKIIKA